jgi:PAS domain S-box-containing protein
MLPAQQSPAVAPHNESNALIVRRVRVGLGVILAGIVLSVLGDHALMSERPLWADLMDGFAIALVAVGFWVSGGSAARNRPIPLALVVIALACGMRAAAGVWFGDLAQTAILCVVIALVAGATLPWGVRPQLATIAIAGAAIAANAYLAPQHVNDPLPHFGIAVAIALLVSVVLAYELQRYRAHLAVQNVQRRRAEEALARMNSDLERRVAERVAELDTTKERLEREALERQQAAVELETSRKRLQDILDNAPAVIHLKGIDGRYQLVNRQWETAFGIPRQDVVGRTPRDFFPPDIVEKLGANDRRVLNTREALQVEETLPQRGELRTYLSVKFPLFDADGVPIGVCGISTDITERNAMQAELRRSEAALSTLVENTTDSIFSVDLDGEIQATNSVFRERFRTRYGVEYERRHAEAMVSRHVWEDMYQLYARAYQGEHVQVERTIPDGERQEYFLISVHPIVENGVVTGATVFRKDITERKRIEAQAREHQAELAHVLRLGTMGEMAAGLAHEINQPLGAIANYAQGCVHRLRAGTTDAAALLPIVEEIAAEALRAGEIIRRLRDLVRKEGPQQQVVDINAVVRKSVQMIEAEARQHAIRVELDLAPDLAPVSCDAIQIEQVLLNLLLNGVEAVTTASNGERVLSVHTAAAGDTAVEVAIRDNGVGLPDSPADVFAPFFSTKPHGLGMGLSISRSIIEAHGGRLSATRNADRGSTFSFVLPVLSDLHDAPARRASNGVMHVS